MNETRLHTIMFILITALFMSVLAITSVQCIQTAITEKDAAAIHWEDSICPSCGGISYLYFDADTGIAVNQCPECGAEEVL